MKQIGSLDAWLPLLCLPGCDPVSLWALAASKCVGWLSFAVLCTSLRVIHLETSSFFFQPASKGSFYSLLPMDGNIIKCIGTFVYVGVFSRQPTTGPPFLIYVAVFSRQPTTGPPFFSPRCRFFPANPPPGPLFKSTLPFFHANPPLGPLLLVCIGGFSPTGPPLFSLRRRFFTPTHHWVPFF